MCGKKQLTQSSDSDENREKDDLKATTELAISFDGNQKTLRDRPTEILSQSVIQEKLDQIRQSIPEKEVTKTEVKKEQPVPSDPKRRFSETLWFMTGLDSDQLVEDSDEDVASDDLQDRYEKKESLSDGIRDQFTLKDGKVDQSDSKSQKETKGA
jgi:hypothetical protein